MDALDTFISSAEKLSTQDLAALSKTINIGLTTSLISSLSELDKRLASIEALSEGVYAAYSRRLQAEIEADVLTLDQLQKLNENLTKTMLDIVEVKRKVFNGKELFNSQVMSDQDRAFLDLLKMLDTEEKRNKLKVYVSELISTDL